MQRPNSQSDSSAGNNHQPGKKKSEPNDLLSLVNNPPDQCRSQVDSSLFTWKSLPPVVKKSAPITQPLNEAKNSPAGYSQPEAHACVQEDDLKEPIKTPKIKRQLRARHYHRSPRLVWVCLLRLAAAITFPTFLCLGVLVIKTRDLKMGSIAISLAVLYATLRGLAFYLSFKLSCSLCHGRLLHSGSALKHAEAKYIPFLGWVWPVILSTLIIGKFRCMYCGTPFRTKK